MPRGIKKMIDFRIGFLTILPPFWNATWSHVGHLLRLRTVQEISKTPQERPRMAQDALKKSLDVPGRLQHASRRFRPSMLVSSGLNFEDFLICFMYFRMAFGINFNLRIPTIIHIILYYKM